MESGHVSIPGRFNGPPASANGGYTCGVAARLLGVPAAAVSLRSPPPLDVPLSVAREAGTVSLRAGAETVVEAIPLEDVGVRVPEPVSPAQARVASEGYPWRHEHPFPTCFVCGPDRPGDDGLSLFTGAVEGRDLFACDWTPAAEWDRGDGRVALEIVWAALDCPSAVAAAAIAGPDPRTAVLARLAATVDEPPAVGEPHAVVAWSIEREDRKRHAGTAILDSSGRTRAHARALWIELRETSAD
jgi:hypothetical protein